MVNEYTICLVSVADPESSAKDLLYFLKQYKLFNKIAADFDPLARIGFRDEKPAFHSPNNEDLFNQVLEAGPEGIRALTSAPYAVLRNLNGQDFLHGEKVLRIVYRPEEERFCPAYARRFVTLVPGSHDAGFVSATDEDFPEEGHPLILRPCVAKIDRQTAEDLARRMMNVGRQGSFLLPPTFVDGPEDSYYANSDETPRVDVREEIARSAGLLHYQVEEPTAVTMWRLLDDPSLRDIFIEGGSLRVLHNAEPTRTSLALAVYAPDPESDPNPVRAYRNQVLNAPVMLPGPKWGRLMGQALRKDLEQTVPHSADGMSFVKLESEAERPVNWNVLPLSGAPARGLPGGNWDCFSSMHSALVRKQLRDFFYGEVLWPSRDNDHDLAEKRFIENFWHCPWSSETRPGPWRLVMGGDLIQKGHDLRSGVQPVRMRHKRWPDKPLPRLSRRQCYYVIEHSGADEDKILQWRLLLPLGALVCRNVIFRVGQGKLNQGYVLAGR